MNLNIIRRKLFSLALCALIIFVHTSTAKTLANIEDIPVQGGSYEEVLNAKKEYIEQHPEDKTVYECHHLIAKEALNKWGDEIAHRRLSNRYNEFIVNDLDQNWAPSITMEKADHEKTLSYYNKYTRTEKQKQDALDYINYQADRIILEGDIIGVLKDECEFIRETFGHKYDEALNQVWAYIKILTFRHPTRNCLSMINPGNPNWYFEYKF